MSVADDKLDLENYRALIAAYQAAVLAIATGGVQEYMLDTGQDIQRVKKIDLQWMRDTLSWLIDQRNMTELRINGGQSIIVRPRF